MKKLWTLLGIIVIVLGLICVGTMQFGLAQTGTNVSGIIFSNTTWTKANSPYMLTGPTAVNTGATLTIEPGATVNINDYYIQVNGTLTAIGSASSMIQINGGLLRFTSVSAGWNDQIKTGCILQYVTLVNASISAGNAIKLDHAIMSGGTVVVGDASVITNSNMGSGITAGRLSTFTGNQINGSVTTGASSTLSNNKIQGSISANDTATITGNTIGSSVICGGTLSSITNNIIGGAVTGGVISNNTISTNYGRSKVQGTTVSNNIITGATVSASSQITNNVIVSGNYTEEFRVFGGYATATENTPAITGTTSGSPNISGNTIKGGGYYRYMFIWSDSTTILPAIDLSSGSASTIYNNTIIGNSGLAINGNAQSILGNTITGDVNVSAVLTNNNTIYGSLSLYNGTPTISNNTVSSVISVNSVAWNITGNTVKGITESQGNGYISDNYVIGTGSNSSGGNSNGIGINILSGGTIQRNYVANNTFGIVIRNSNALLLNNTIVNNGVGISLYSPNLATAINYNNIQSNNQNVVLELGTTNNVDATYNWWGTSNAQAIGQTIYDYKNDFNLGNVTYVPFLTTANPKAMPSPNTQTPTSYPTPTSTPSPTIAPTASPTSAPTDTPITAPTSDPTTNPTDTTIPTTTPTDSPSPTQTPATTNPEPSNTIPELPIWIILILAMALVIASIIVKKNPVKQLTG